MELSHYLKAYPFEEREGYVLLFSTRNTSKVLVKKNLYHELQHGVTPAEKQALLSKLGIIVSDPIQEKRDVFGFFEHINRQNQELSITAVVNLDCNFACRYCYESGQKGAHYMRADTATALTAFAQKRLQEGKNAILVDFYGGEPLLSLDLIKDISRELHHIAKEKDASYRFTLVTNGSLFKRPVAEQLVPLGLYSVRITLDGPPETHNCSRPFKSGAGSFDAIINNIKANCDITRINIGGNYEHDNYRQFPQLLDHLMKEGLTPDKIASVKFDPVNKIPEGFTTGLVDYDGGCRSINEPWLAEASMFLREEILKRGYFTPKARPIVCMIEQQDAFVVNYDGTLYKCPALLGREEFAVGNVCSGVRTYGDSHKLENWKNDACGACPYLPLCFGGCRYAALVEAGSLEVLDCKKDYFDACLEIMVKQDIRYRASPRTFSPATHDGDPIDISPITQTIDYQIKTFFPHLFEAFIPPSLEKIASSYRNADKLIKTYVYGHPYKDQSEENHFSESGFLSAAMIRYVDDFVDNVLWPRIRTFEPSALEERFSRFLAKTVQAMRAFDPDLPDSIGDLLRLEMELALHHDQQTFDQNIEPLFRCKSFDLYYVYRKIHCEEGCLAAIPDHLMRVALMDYLRDFDDKAIATDKDLNLYTLVRDHCLNPQELIRLLITIYKQEDPKGFCRTRDAGLFEGIKGVDLQCPEKKTDIPLHERFSELFQKAVSKLRELQ